MSTVLAGPHAFSRIALPTRRLTDRLLAAWFVGWYAFYAWRGGLAWHFFVQGQQVLSDPDGRTPGGLHLYAVLPQLQIGPVALVGAWLFSPFGRGFSLVIAQVFCAGAGLAILHFAGVIARETRPDLDADRIGNRIRWAAVFFIPVWLYLAVASVHLDDVLALLFGVLAMLAAVRQRAVLAGVLAGLAVDSKPWALPFAAILLVLAGPRARALGVAALALAIGACWLPFLIGDPHTVNAMRFTIVNTPRTALRVLGIDDPRTPWWDRPAQSVLGVLLGAVATWRGRWAATMLLAVAARLVLDPGTNMYYAAGLVAGAAIWDIAGSRRNLPWWTALAAGALFAARYGPVPPSLNGWLTLGFFLASTAVLAIRPADPPPAAPAAVRGAPVGSGAGVAS